MIFLDIQADAIVEIDVVAVRKIRCFSPLENHEIFVIQKVQKFKFHNFLKELKLPRQKIHSLLYIIIP